jgi:hypothetical protein
VAEIVHPPFAGATVHNQYLTLSGNTAGASTWSGTNLVYSGSNLSITGDTLFVGGGAATYRSNAWSLLGVYVSSVSPTNPIVYTDWLAGSTGYFGWLSIPP